MDPAQPPQFFGFLTCLVDCNTSLFHDTSRMCEMYRAHFSVGQLLLLRSPSANERLMENTAIQTSLSLCRILFTQLAFHCPSSGIKHVYAGAKWGIIERLEHKFGPSILKGSKTAFCLRIPEKFPQALTFPTS